MSLVKIFFFRGRGKSVLVVRSSGIVSSFLAEATFGAQLAHSFYRHNPIIPDRLLSLGTSQASAIMEHMSQNSSRKYLIFGAIGLGVVALLLGGFMLFGRGDAANPVGPTPKPTLPPEPVNVIPVEERPYARLYPSADGRTVIVSLEKLNKPAEDGEYEIEYQSGTVLQGAGGALNVEDLPDVEEILLGSCSAGGKCTYHEDVTGGLLTFRLEGSNRYAVRGEWSFLENPTGDKTLSSRDGKLGLTGAGTKPKFGIVFQSPGYPDALPGRALSQIYAIGTSTASTGSVVVSLHLNEAVTAASLATWDGKTWKTVPGTVAEKTLTVTLPSLPQAMIAVASE